MTKEPISTAKCDICLNEVPENMTFECPDCGKIVCSQCSEPTPEDYDEVICVECLWNGRGSSGQGAWRLALWNLHFAGARPQLILSEDDVKEARVFLIQNNYPKPADCPWRKCPLWAYTCDSVNTCQVAMRMCHDAWDGTANDVERATADGAEEVAGECPECGGTIMTGDMGDTICAKCGLVFSVLPDIIDADRCTTCAATADCRSYGPISQGCTSTQMHLRAIGCEDAAVETTSQRRGQVFYSGFAGMGPL